MGHIIWLQIYDLKFLKWLLGPTAAGLNCFWTGLFGPKTAIEKRFYSLMMQL